MANPNKMIAESSKLTKKLKDDLKRLMALYDELHRDVDTKFKTEYINQNGSTDGLEDFYALILDLKTNRSKLKNTFSLLSRLKDITKYDIDETEKKIDDEKEIEDIIDGTFK